MGTQHEPMQTYLIEPKIEQLLHDFAESTGHIVTKLARFHIGVEGIHQCKIRYVFGYVA